MYQEGIVILSIVQRCREGETERGEIWGVVVEIFIRKVGLAERAGAKER